TTELAARSFIAVRSVVLSNQTGIISTLPAQAQVWGINPAASTFAVRRREVLVKAGVKWVKIGELFKFCRIR
ncbi:MAG: hypothetical protein L0Z53_01190, partial [Acidobacteriales bacterium]|nr:hypothetical protein [Terriglobales bacterium]